MSIDPVHPAVVHFPIAIATLIPLFAIGALVAVARGAAPARAWGVVLALQILLTGTALAAMFTGESDALHIGSSVARDHIEAHELAGSWLVYGSLVILIAALLGLAQTKTGRVARMLNLVGATALAYLGLTAGNSGGDLVYDHGAAQAYSDASPQKPR